MLDALYCNTLSLFSTAVYLEETESSRALCANVYGAPACDGDAVALMVVHNETERGVLDEIHDLEDRVCGASLQVKVSECVAPVCRSR